VLELRDKYKTPGVGYGHIKQDLLKTILNHFEEARNRRLELEKDISSVYDILKNGAQKAESTALHYLQKVREVTGLSYRL
ncbi:MAG: tryptophan--tRNA ligase, partial [Spirochaetia bacterium]|nr:tryptophan--tRNA ligase [Spirochaetia bacterium]